MKSNRFKEILAAGKSPVGHMIMEFSTRGMAQLLDTTGIDFVVVDMEHAGYSFGDVATLMALFKGTTIAPFVRVPEIQYHLIAPCLDTGALGIMAPNVKNAAEAKAVVDAVKYAPLGQRGVALGTANTDFRPVNAAEFLSYANQNTTVICQIESQEGLDNLDAIATTPGVDVLWVGHFDLSHSLGIVGQLHHPKLLEALNLVVGTARRHGIAAGIQPRTMDQAREWLTIGFNVISCGSDFVVYADALTQRVGEVRAAMKS